MSARRPAIAVARGSAIAVAQRSAISSAPRNRGATPDGNPPAASRARCRAWSWLAGLTAALALVACAQQQTTDEHGGAPPSAAPAACACDDTVPVVDPTLLAFLSLARAAHHEADLAVDGGDHAIAIQALERVVKSPWPGKKPPEVLEVTADTLARLADLKSQDGKFDEAARDVTEGITIALAPTHFRGRLFEIRGLVEERRTKALEEKGDTAAAGRARKAAIEAFGQAMDIQENVISRALEEKEKEKGGK